MYEKKTKFLLRSEEFIENHEVIIYFDDNDQHDDFCQWFLAGTAGDVGREECWCDGTI